MTTQEKIDVMQAYLDGKPIQIRNRAVVSEWTDLEVKEPSWNWNTYVYRVKPGSKLRPYKNAEEFLQAQKDHGPYFVWEEFQYHVFPNVILNYGMLFHDEDFRPASFTYEQIINYRWQDGTPCGITEE